MIIARPSGVGDCTSCTGMSLSGSTMRGLRGLGRLNSLSALGDIEYTQAHAIYGAMSLAGMGLSDYHGYKRNNSVGWAIGWGFLGALFPIITVPVALAQGFGKRRGR